MKVSFLYFLGAALLKVGGAEQRLGLAERDFVGSALTDFLQPLQKFLDTEMKTITRERRLLDTKRLFIINYIIIIQVYISIFNQSSADTNISILSLYKGVSSFVMLVFLSWGNQMNHAAYCGTNLRSFDLHLA